MYTSVSFHKILPQHVGDYITNMKVCAEASNKEPGCIRYEVMQCQDDPTLMCLLQVFAGADAYQAHQDAPHHQVWVGLSRDWRDGPATNRHEMTHVTPLREKR